MKTEKQNKISRDFSHSTNLKIHVTYLKQVCSAGSSCSHNVLVALCEIQQCSLCLSPSGFSSDYSSKAAAPTGGKQGSCLFSKLQSAPQNMPAYKDTTILIWFDPYSSHIVLSVL